MHQYTNNHQQSLLHSNALYQNMKNSSSTMAAANTLSPTSPTPSVGTPNGAFYYSTTSNPSSSSSSSNTASSVTPPSLSFPGLSNSNTTGTNNLSLVHAAAVAAAASSISGFAHSATVPSLSLGVPTSSLLAAAQTARDSEYEFLYRNFNEGSITMTSPQTAANAAVSNAMYMMAPHSASPFHMQQQHSSQSLFSNDINKSNEQINGKFTSKFNKSFQRVNKRTGKKNLRCFPTCSPTGHKPDGFCGRPVALKVTGLNPSPVDGEVIAFAEICLSQNSERFVVNSIYPFSDLQKIERTKASPNHELIRSSVTFKRETSEYIVEVNKQEEAWHYPWNATRHTSRMPHNLRIYLFLKNGANARCVGHFMSDQFGVICGRHSDGVSEKGKNLDSDALDDENEAAENESESDKPKSKKRERNASGKESKSSLNDNVEASTNNSVDSGDKDQSLPTQKGKMKKVSNGKETQSKLSANHNIVQENNKEGKASQLSIKTDKDQSYDVLPVTFDDDDDEEGSSDAEDAQFDSPRQKKNRLFFRLMESLSYGALTGDSLYYTNKNAKAPPTADGQMTNGQVGLQVFSSVLLGEILSGQEADFTAIFNNSVSSPTPGVESSNGQPQNNENDSAGASSSSSRKKTLPPLPPRMDVPTVAEKLSVESAQDAEVRATLARDLSDFLLNEECFTKDVSEFFRSCKQIENSDASVEEYFGKFFNIVTGHIEGFLASRNISLDSLDEKLSIGHPSKDHYINKVKTNKRFSNQAKSLKMEFLRRIQNNPFAEVFDSDIPRLTEPEFDLEGTWVYIGEDTAANQVVNELNSRGFPGFLLHFFRKSMVKFHININRDWLYFKGPEKLAHDLQYLFSLDGKEHSWVFPQLIPLASPVRSINYIGSVDYEKKCIRIDQYGIFLPLTGYMLRVVREFRLSGDGIELYVHTLFELVNSIHGTRESLGEINSPYLRVWRKEDASNLLNRNGNSVTDR